MRSQRFRLSELIIARKVQLSFFAGAVPKDVFLAATDRGFLFGRKQHHCYSGLHSCLLLQS